MTGKLTNSQREADRVAANQFVPPGVLINAQLQIIQFRGPTGAFFEPPQGKASFNVLKMARDGLMLPLRAAIREATTEHRTVRKVRVRMGANGGTRLVTIHVIPLKNLKEPCLLILFEQVPGGSVAANMPPAPRPKRLTKRAESMRIADCRQPARQRR